MKKTLLLASVATLALSASAQWIDGKDGELPLYNENRAYPSYDIATSAHGNTWFYINEITSVAGKPTEVYCCQALDSEGKTMMGDQPVRYSEFPYQSYVMYNHNIFIDRDGNAIMAVQDCRKDIDIQQTSVYKVSPSGVQMWGEDGIDLTGDVENCYLCSFTGCQLSDGSYVFAWMNTADYSSPTEINIMRLNEDGSLAWQPGDVKLSDSRVPYAYPTIIDAGDGQFNLVYAEGSGEVIKVMKYDSKGSTVWDKPVEVYNGGWGSTPMWLKCQAKSSGDGGVIVAWYDDRYYTDFEDAYLAYVKPNGTLGFNQRNGIKLDYTDCTRDIGVDVVYDSATDSFVAGIRVTDYNQAYYTLKAQRISKSGDLLWGENAIELGETIRGGYSTPCVVCGEDGRVAFFYQKHTDVVAKEINNYVDYYDVKTGKSVWDEPLNFGVSNTPKKNLQAGNCGKFWTVSWMGGVWIEDDEYPGGGYYSESEGNINVQRINFDGTFGNKTSGVDPINPDDANHFIINGNTVEFVNQGRVYDIGGRVVGEGKSVTLNPGIYMGVEGSKSAKFAIR